MYCRHTHLNEIDESLTNFDDAHVALFQRWIKFEFVEISYAMHIPKHPILLATQFSWHIFVIESLHVAINTAVHRPNVEFLVAQ